MCPLCFLRRSHLHEENHRDPAAAHSRADAHRLRRPHPRRAQEDLARGTWDGNTFVSEFAELILTLPEAGWTISTDEEIADGLRAADVFDYEVGETSRTTLCGNDYLLLTATYGNTTDDLLALFHD